MLLLLLISCVTLATVLRVVHLLLVALRVRDPPRLNVRLLRQVGLRMTCIATHVALVRSLLVL